MSYKTDSVQPTLIAERLQLRPFVRKDAVRVAELAGARSIADTTISIPHPYPTELAADWISTHVASWQVERAAHFAIELRPQGVLAGSVSVRDLDRAHYQAELGFWIGEPFWGQGLATEALRCVLSFTFGPLGLNRLHAHHMARNPASGRVLEKVGFRREGLLRQRVIKWGRFEDVVILSLLRQDWEKQSGSNFDENSARD
jgi:RimJ/RimL family protein N-acetyltransferase